MRLDLLSNDLDLAVTTMHVVAGAMEFHLEQAGFVSEEEWNEHVPNAS